MTPSAVWSLAAKTAVTSGSAASRSPRRNPARPSRPPADRRAGAGVPRRASAQPRMRAAASIQLFGPGHVVRRCGARGRADAGWRPGALELVDRDGGHAHPGGPPTTTRGRSRVEPGTASTTRTGATTMTPSTWDARSRSSVARHVVAAPAEGDKGEQMARLPSRRIDPEEHVRRTELLGLDRHDAERPATVLRPAHAPPCWLGTERSDGLLDPAPRLVGDTGEPVEDPGHGHDRDAGPRATSAMTTRRGCHRQTPS